MATTTRPDHIPSGYRLNLRNDKGLWKGFILDKNREKMELGTWDYWIEAYSRAALIRKARRKLKRHLKRQERKYAAEKKTQDSIEVIDL